MKPESCGILDFYEKKCQKCSYANKCAINRMIENEKEFYIKYILKSAPTL